MKKVISSTTKKVNKKLPRTKLEKKNNNIEVKKPKKVLAIVKENSPNPRDKDKVARKNNTRLPIAKNQLTVPEINYKSNSLIFADYYNYIITKSFLKIPEPLELQHVKSLLLMLPNDNTSTELKMYIKNLYNIYAAKVIHNTLNFDHFNIYEDFHNFIGKLTNISPEHWSTKVKATSGLEQLLLYFLPLPKNT